MTSLINFSESHLEETYRWISDKRIRKNFFLRRTITFQDHLNWFESYQNDCTQKIFAITENDIHCGNCGFKFINPVDEKAELWIYLGGTTFEGRGVASSALRLLLNFGFNELGLNKVYLHVAENNLRALKLYQREGFKLEGIFERDMKIDDEYITIKRLCCFRNEGL